MSRTGPTRSRVPVRLIIFMVCIVAAGPLTVALLHTLRGDPARPSLDQAAGATPPSVPAPSASALAIPVPSGAGPASSVPLSFRSFVGTWRVHGSSMQINADLTGSTVWNAGPCGPPTPEVMCTGHADLMFTASATRVGGELTTVSYRDEQDRPVPDFDAGADGPRVGDQFTLVLVDTDVLRQTRQPPTEGGNPYLCGPRASDDWRVRCNV